ncbi:MAG: N-acetylmuramoyl-L-alanine amidase [Verrucomicrobiota bacterium]
MLRSAILIAAGLATCLILSRASAATRHWVLTASLVATAALPFLSHLPVPWNSPPAFSVNIPLALDPITTPRADAIPDEAGPPIIAGGEDTVPVTTGVTSILPWRTIALAVWLTGVAVVLTRMLLSAFWLARLKAASRPAERTLVAELDQLLPHHHIKRPVRLLTMPPGENIPPLTSGLRHSWIALPHNASQWKSNSLRVVLDHELAHIARNDLLVRWFCQIFCASQWCNPLAWILARRISVESENACDDVVLARGVSVRTYADTVLEIAANTRSSDPIALAPAMAQEHDLESRLRRILDPRINRRKPRAHSRLCLAAAATLVALAIAFLVSGPSHATPSTPRPNTTAFDVVVIDAGHGGHDSGAMAENSHEADFALDVARQLRNSLKEDKSLRVVTTRDRDLHLTLSRRLAIAAEYDRAVLVSIHFNASPNENVSGSEIAYSPDGHSDSGPLALAIGEALDDLSSTHFRGVRPERYTLLRDASQPAVIVDGGYLTNPGDLNNALKQSYRRELAEAIAEGLQNFRAGNPLSDRENPGPDSAPGRTSSSSQRSAESPSSGNITAEIPLADGFDYPVAPLDDYYVSRGFRPNAHAGEDWNGRAGGNTDLGDPVLSIGDGLVVLSENVKKGYGNVVIVRHRYRDSKGEIKFVDSYYGHLLNRTVTMGDTVKRGQPIGEIGNNDGMYTAHLCLQVRKNLEVGINAGRYPINYDHYHSPRDFIVKHRPTRR